MRAFAFVAAVALIVGQTEGARARDEKEPAFQASAEHLDKSWNLTVKSTHVKEVVKDSLGDRKFKPAKTFAEVHVTLEFVKEPASVKEMQRRFVIESKMPKVGELALKEPQTQLWLLDGDGVVLKKFEPWSIEGEITGVAKDAFRVVIYVEPELLKKTKKIDLRPAKN